MSTGMNDVLVGHSSTMEQWIALEDRFNCTTQLWVMELLGKLQSLAKNGFSISDSLYSQWPGS